jgi:dihydrofolate reductase
VRRIINATYMSLDGVVQHPEHWTFDYRSDDAAQASHDQLFGADALIMGRHTYDIFVDHWPTATDANGFADRMNTMPKYVLSHSLSEPTWSNTAVLDGDDVVDRIRELKGQPGRTILQYGYGPVTRLLIDHGLLDELRIWLHPLLVGSSAASDQIGAVGTQARVQLKDVRCFDSGLVILTYQRPHGE